MGSPRPPASRLTRVVAAGTLVASLAAFGPPAWATTVPLADPEPGLRCLSVGATDLTLHAAFDWSLEGVGRGWTLGLVGGYDLANPLRRDSHTMLAGRVLRRLGSLWPFEVAVMVSGGLNVVDPDAPVANPTEQDFWYPVLPWVQPAVVASWRPSEEVWVRASFGPVIGRFTAGRIAMPWFVPNVEVAYRIFRNQEVVLSGGYASPYGLGWRVAL
ncbi:MAG: hypothetical protein VKQ33_01115 [Candidatus Sericytochromatia bacterium]|nr:hypothetical protein [Candidatus Sericytochromatia bacterium]